MYFLLNFYEFPVIPAQQRFHFAHIAPLPKVLSAKTIIHWRHSPAHRLAPDHQTDRQNQQNFIHQKQRLPTTNGWKPL